MLGWRKWKSAAFCSTSAPGQAMIAIDPERLLRAFSVACASMCWKGKGDDTDGIQGLADDFYEYINGDDNTPMPRPDKLQRGQVPKP